MDEQSFFGQAVGVNQRLCVFGGRYDHIRQAVDISQVFFEDWSDKRHKAKNFHRIFNRNVRQNNHLLPLPSGSLNQVNGFNPGIVELKNVAGVVPLLRKGDIQIFKHGLLIAIRREKASAYFFKKYSPQEVVEFEIDADFHD